ncbi:MAG: hypothetical protein IJ033_02930 [Clostridia bacterium]|nr:hypothetical protein [Clostridia bacterium]
MGVYEDFINEIKRQNERDSSWSKGAKSTSAKKGLSSILSDGASAFKQLLKNFGYTLSKIGKSKEDKVALAEGEYQNPRVSENTTSDALINTLIEMDNEYRAGVTGVDLSAPTLPSTLGLSEKEYVPKTDDELKAEVEAELLPDYVSDVNEATERYEKEVYDAKSKRESAEYQEALDEAELKESYLAAKEDHRDDMIFKGLTNSTINLSGERTLKDGYDYESALIDEKYDRKYTELQHSIKEAETEFKNAMESYDLNYSADLQEKLQKLREKEEKRLEEINKYNLDVRKKELEYQQTRAEKLSELRAERQSALFAEMEREQAHEKVFGISAEKRVEYTRRVDMAKTFYQNFSKEQAEKMMESVAEELLNLLGREEYFNLIYWNMAR